MKHLLIRRIHLIVILYALTSPAFAGTLHVGSGQQYTTLSQAMAVVMPGDTILVHEGIYAGGLFFANIQGTAQQWISLLAVPGETVIFQGGNNAWQLSDAAYLHIRGFIFEHQTGNGVNIDDGGTFDTPAHHIVFQQCTFRNISATGNNDLLKLSGVDSFEVRNCVFLNGAAGGSGIDMVGCHDGVITGCMFENMGSNAIQAKGGTRNILIEANNFKNAGQRALNLGGSTGLQFFRPQDAEYEAADLKVYSNLFTGSTAPIAFVGCINSEVINNTIFLPDNWVLRILQETVDPDRFHPCGNNAFINNLIVIDNNVNVVCNIGPNTAPKTFTFAHNLWYHTQQPAWSGPVLPVTDQNNIVGADPLFADEEDEDFTLLPGSPALGAGAHVTAPVLDYARQQFMTPRAIGALEGASVSGIPLVSQTGLLFDFYPNPAREWIHVVLHSRSAKDVIIQLYTPEGQLLHAIKNPGGIEQVTLPATSLTPGVFMLCCTQNSVTECRQLIVQK